MGQAKIEQESPERAALVVSGDWLEYRDVPAWQDVIKALGEGTSEVRFVGSDLGKWNTCVVTFLFCVMQWSKERSITINADGLPKGVRVLLGLASAVPERKFDSGKKPFIFAEKIFDRWAAGAKRVEKVIEFVGELCSCCGRYFFGKTRTENAECWRQLVRCGHQALAIVSMVGFLIGVILAFIGSIPLKMFGAEVYLASLIGIGVLRLMAPVMVGVVMSGRTGAAFAAELGAMVAQEETDAYIAMGLSPMEILVVPRALALTVAMPLLCMYANLMGILGGLLVAITYAGNNVTTYVDQLVATTSLNHLWIGLVTAWVFGILISICGCYHGLRSGRNSSAVGQAATAAVVSSIVCMVLATAVITVMTVFLGI